MFIISVLFVNLLDASYFRTIRIASFPTSDSAQESLIELNNFKQEHKNLVELQKEWNFEFKVKKVGDYYITLVEPFSNKRVLQEVVDTLRTEYKDIYVKKEFFQEDKAEIEEEIVVSEVIEENTTIVVIPEVKTNITVDSSKNVDDSTINIWLILFVITALLLLVVLRFLFIAKRENETYVNNNIINDEKFSQLNLEMKTKEKFLFHTSHELRTPMTAIIGLTHLVLESDLSPEQKDYVQRIESSSKNLVNIINDVLDISKIQAGELKIEQAEFNINEILEYVISIISIQAKNNNIHVYMNIDNDVPSRIVGDSLRLGQILINLLGNAVKFTKDGEISLNVKKLSNFGDNVSLEFVVSDTGIGMTSSQVDTIFQSYSQANDSTSRKYGGTGLGLTISKTLVEIMNGSIRVDSKKDVGTSFTFNIKFKLKDADNKRQYRLPSLSMMNKKILVIDPSNKNVISLIQGLGYFNYKTHSIPSFEEVVLEDDITFDIIIIEQSKLTQVCIENIKKMQEKNKFKIVVLSDLYSSINDKKLDDLKIDAYLKIPFTKQAILKMIIELYAPTKHENNSKKKHPKDKLKNITTKKVLVAEDNELNHKVIKGLLAQTAIELTFVLDGQEVLDLIQKGIKFDLILMDINMPKIGGYEASKEIRKNSEYNNLPILALTADVMDESIEEALSSGMQGHISKPIIIDIFYKKIFDALNDKKIEITTKEDSKTVYTKEEDDEFEELSTSTGLSRCDNDRDSYKLSLKEFKRMYLNSPSNIKELCQNEDFKNARKKAMLIKDTALNIGAYNLCEHAATMEYEFEKGSRSSWNRLIDLYSASLDKLLKDIDKYLDRI